MGEKSKQLRDCAILRGISGANNILSCGMEIDDDYFARERRENDEESGLSIPEHDLHGMGERELSIYRCQKLVEETEAKRVNQILPEYAGYEEAFIMSDEQKKQVEMKLVDSEKLDTVIFEGRIAISSPVTTDKSGTKSPVTYINFLDKDGVVTNVIYIGNRRDRNGQFKMTTIKNLQIPDRVQDYSKAKVLKL